MGLGRRLGGAAWIGVTKGVGLVGRLGGYFKFGGFGKGRRTVVRGLLSNESAFMLVPANNKGSLYCRLPSLLVRKATVMVSPLVTLVGGRISTVHGFDRRSNVTRFVGSSLGGNTVSRIGSSVLTKGAGLLCITPRSLAGRRGMSFLHSIGVSFCTMSRTRYVSR